MSDTSNKGWQMIRDERIRQQNKEGWDESHDAQHTDESLAYVAAYYAIPRRAVKHSWMGIHIELETLLWPNSWHPKYAKKNSVQLTGGKTRVKELAIAGALIAAEIDRLLCLEAIRNKG